MQAQAWHYLRFVQAPAPATKASSAVALHDDAQHALDLLVVFTPEKISKNRNPSWSHFNMLFSAALIATAVVGGPDKIGVMRRAQGVTEPQHCAGCVPFFETQLQHTFVSTSPSPPLWHHPLSSLSLSIPTTADYQTFSPPTTSGRFCSDCDQLERLDVTALIAQGQFT